MRARLDIGIVPNEEPVPWPLVIQPDSYNPLDLVLECPQSLRGIADLQHNDPASSEPPIPSSTHVEDYEYPKML